MASPNSRPKEVDVTKKPDIEASRPAEVNPTKVKPEMETKVKPDIDAAAASASAVPKVKAQEPDLPKAGQPEVTPDAGKKVQKPEEVDNPNSDKGISQQTPRVILGQDGVVTGGSSTKLGKNMMEDMGLSRGQKWTGYQAQHIIPADMADHPVIQKWVWIWMMQVMGNFCLCQIR